MKALHSGCVFLTLLKDTSSIKRGQVVMVLLSGAHSISWGVNFGLQREAWAVWEGAEVAKKILYPYSLRLREKAGAAGRRI